MVATHEPQKSAPRVRTKVPRTYRLTPATVAAAQRALGARTATEAIEVALDLVLFRQELVRGTAAIAGTHIEPPDSDR